MELEKQKGIGVAFIATYILRGQETMHVYQHKNNHFIQTTVLESTKFFTALENRRANMFGNF